jgi:hypothetical protein
MQTDRTKLVNEKRREREKISRQDDRRSHIWRQTGQTILCMEADRTDNPMYAHKHEIPSDVWRQAGQTILCMEIGKTHNPMYRDRQDIQSYV